MKLRLLGSAVLMVLALGSCSTLKTITGITVSQKYVAVAVQGFDAAKVTATNYLRLPNCTASQSTLKDGCKDATVVPTLIKDVRAGSAARDTLWTSSKASVNGVGAIDLYNAVIAATGAIKTDVSK